MLLGPSHHVPLLVALSVLLASAASYNLTELRAHALKNRWVTAEQLVSEADLPQLMRPPNAKETQQYTIAGPIEQWQPNDKAYGGSPDNAYVAICTSSRDDNPYIREWVAYHRCAGVGKIYIIDDRSREPMLT